MSDTETIEKRRWQFVFDIETGPVDEEVINGMDLLIKVDSRLKDPAKIEAARAAKLEKAALDPFTGQVLMIGVMDAETCQMWRFEGPEKAMLEKWWGFFESYDRGSARFIGFNIFNFDLPFLIVRSHLHDVRVPFSFREACSKHTLRNWFDDIQDLVYPLQAGKVASHGLDNLMKLMLGRGKTGSGADFAELLKTDRAAALAYLEADVRGTRDLAVKVGLVSKNESKNEVAA